MPIAVPCPTCAARVRLPDNAGGRRFRCPKCRVVFVAPVAETGSTLDDAPAPITEAARQALRDHFNPFDDGTKDEETPRHKRHFKPKDDYNPFAEPSTAETVADTGEVFDFGATEPAPPSTGEFDFDSSSPPEHGPRRRRR